MKAIILTVFLTLLAQIPALAQDPSPAAPPPADRVFGDNVSADVSPSPGVPTPTPVPDIPLLSGTLITVIPSDPANTIGLQIDPNTQVTYRLAMVFVIVGLDGKVVDPSTVAIGANVRVHFLKDRDESIIDRIFLQ